MCMITFIISPQIQRNYSIILPFPSVTPARIPSSFLSPSVSNVTGSAVAIKPKTATKYPIPNVNQTHNGIEGKQV